MSTISTQTTVTSTVNQILAPDPVVIGNMTVKGSIDATDYLENGVPLNTQSVVVNGVLTLPSTVTGSTSLVAGSKTILNSDVSASSVFILTPQVLSGASVARTYYISARVPGVSFTIRSTMNNDTSVIGWLKVG